MTESAFSADPVQNDMTAELVLVLTQTLHFIEQYLEASKPNS